MHLKSSLLPFWQFVNVTQAMLNVAKVGVSTLSWYRVQVQTHIGTGSKKIILSKEYCDTMEALLLVVPQKCRKCLVQN